MKNLIKKPTGIKHIDDLVESVAAEIEKGNRSKKPKPTKKPKTLTITDINKIADKLTCCDTCDYNDGVRDLRNALLEHLKL